MVFILASEIINKGINYILENLQEDLTVEEIADYCHFSKFYFNRMFKSIVGESVYSFIKRLRIEKSALQLAVEHDKTITEIGNRYGYSSSNYSTAFKKRYGKSPHEFKKQRLNDAIRHNESYYVDLSKTSYEFYNSKIDITYIPEIKVIYKRYIGNYHDLSKFWSEFCHNHKNYIDENSIFYEITYDDPILTDPDRCITDLAVTTTKPVDENQIAIIKGGKFAVYTFEGPNTKIFETFQGLLGTWLTNTTYKPDLRNRKIIAKYNSIDTDINHFSIDIRIPLV